MMPQIGLIEKQHFISLSELWPNWEFGLSLRRAIGNLPGHQNKSEVIVSKTIGLIEMFEFHLFLLHVVQVSAK